MKVIIIFLAIIGIYSSCSNKITQKVDMLSYSNNNDTIHNNNKVNGKNLMDLPPSYELPDDL